MTGIDLTRGNRLFIVILLMLLALVASSPLFASGWFLSHEKLAPVKRVIALAYEIRAGNFYPRWLSITYWGKGSPFFNFYSPGFYLPAAYLHVAGVPVVTALKVEIWALFVSGAWGIYLWLRKHYRHYGALTAAVLYLFVPYHFVDLYVRGAMAEFSALAFLPYLFHGIDLCLTHKDKKRGIFITGASSAAILLFHHLSALMITPFAVIYCIGRALGGAGGIRGVGTVFIGGMLGAGLSAYYWLPVLTERRYLRNFAGAVTDGYFSYTNHFVLPSQWFSSFWGFGFSVPGGNDQMSFQIGWVLLVYLFFAAITLVLVPATVRRFVFLTLFLGSFGIFLTSEYAAFLYRVAPTFQYVQFPWRFLGPATLFLAASGGLCAVVQRTGKVPWGGICVTSAILLVVLGSGMQRAVGKMFDVNFAALEGSLFRDRGVDSLCEKDEYLPRWVSGSSWDDSRRMPFSTTGEVSKVDVRPSFISFAFNGTNRENMVTVPWFYFPGWRVAVDGAQVDAEPGSEGFIIFRTPQGRHEVVVKWGTSWPRIAGWLIAAFSGLVAAAFLAFRKRIALD